jgi:serine/threonine protein kinase
MTSEELLSAMPEDVAVVASRGYSVIGKIGSGSDSDVYECIERKTRRRVAVKIIPKRHPESKLRPPKSLLTGSEQDRLERARREAKVLELLGDHPYIVSMQEWFETEEALYIVLEHAGGGDLFEALYSHELNPTQTVLQEHCARRIFIQICAAVLHMHKKGVCHRDLKPENIFLDNEWNVKVGDFGLSLCFIPGQQTSDPVGSLIYASPEVLRREPYAGPELDVWALGVMLYEMLCGAPPFVGESERDLCNAILAGEYTVPDFVSSGARSLINKMIKIKQYRISLEAVFDHPWLVEGLQNSLTAQRRRKRRGSLLTPTMAASRLERSPQSSRKYAKKRKEVLEKDDDEEAHRTDVMDVSGEVPRVEQGHVRDEEDVSPGATGSPRRDSSAENSPSLLEVTKDDDITCTLSGDLEKLALYRKQDQGQPDRPLSPFQSFSSPSIRV